MSIVKRRIKELEKALADVLKMLPRCCQEDENENSSCKEVGTQFPTNHFSSRDEHDEYCDEHAVMHSIEWGFQDLYHAPRIREVKKLLTAHGRSTPAPMRKPTCLCGSAGEADDEFDAYFCPVSGVWLEPKCSEPDSYCNCASRPDVKVLKIKQ